MAVTVTDVTSKVLDEFNNNVPDGNPPREAQRRILLPNNGVWPLPTWNPPLIAGYHYFDDPPVDERTGDLRFVTQTLRPQTMEFVFQINGIDVPKMVAVSWPLALSPLKMDPRRPASIPFLVYYRPEPIPSGGKDRFGPDYVPICHKPPFAPDKVCEVFNLKPYPWNWDFLFYVFWNYLNYRCDPLTYNDERWRFGRFQTLPNGTPLPLQENDEKFSFGLPYQIQAAGKPLVLVLPIAGVRTHGDFRDASVVQDTLEAIQRLIFEKHFEPMPPPPVDWVALAGYSKSNKTVARFLTEHKSHPFVSKAVKEVYLFDPAPTAPPEDAKEVNNALLQVMAWAARGTEFKAIRAYSSGKQFSAFTEILGEPLPAAAAFRHTRRGVQIGNTNRFQPFPWSVAWLPGVAWTGANRRVGAQDRERQADYSRREQQITRDLANARTLEDTNNAFDEQWALKEQKEYDKENKIGGTTLGVHLAMAAMCLTDAVRRNGFDYTRYRLPGHRFIGVDATFPRRVLAGV